MEYLHLANTDSDLDLIPNFKFNKMPNVKFITPSSYSQQAAELDRRQRMAELMQQQAMEPIQTQSAGGIVLPVSPVAGLSKLLRSYMSSRQLSDVASKRAALEQQDIAAARQMAEEFGRPTVELPIAQNDTTLRELNVRRVPSSTPGGLDQTQLVSPASESEIKSYLLPKALGAGVGPYQQQLAQLLYTQKPEAPKGSFAPINMKDVDVTQSDIANYRETGNPAYLVMKEQPEMTEYQRRRLAQIDLAADKQDGSKASKGEIFALPTGQIVASVFENGKYYYDTPTGRKPIPPDARPTTAGVAAPLSQSQFIKYRQEIERDKNALSQLNNYFSTVKDMNVGFSRLADQISANAKNFFGNPLKAEELATQLAKGQVQGLVGLFRTDIVGPGVVTEQDAQRIMSALGGDPSKLQNPQVTESLLRNLYDTKKANIEFLQGELSRSNPYYGTPAPPTIPNFNQPVSSAGNTVVAPNGKTYVFSTPEQAAAFKQRVGTQ